MDKKLKSIPIELLYNALQLKGQTSKGRYNQHNPLHEYWLKHRDKLEGLSFNKFYSLLSGVNKTHIEIEYRKTHNQYGGFSKWF